MTQQIQHGDQITYTAGGAITAGTIYRPVGAAAAAAGVNVTTGVSGDLISAAFEGVFTVTKAAGASENWAVGDKVYANSTPAGTKTATSNPCLGICVEAAATGATTGKVKLCSF